MSSESERVEELEAQVASLKKTLEEREKEIADLRREIPLGVGNKPKRLGLEVRKMQQDEQEAAVQWPAYKVRETFIDFFREKCGHVFWRSSPVVPHNDPTLLFTNAGMNQYKPLFLGQADPNLEISKLKRAANTQKCIRAGGKHNDLEDVGKDVYHHTFFEMLGNWSFGDYFKEEAIDWAWELLTEVYGLDPNRLYITYFEGNEAVPADNEARNFWLKHVPESRVLPFDAKDNFWEMGDTGPCGPCSEIHYDRIGGRDAASLVNMDDPNVVEIWNLVFIQFNRKPDGSLEKLPACHVDTGMGFERLTSALQNKFSNYDTDVFTPLFRAIESYSSVHPYTGMVGAEDEGNIDMAYRVVADHIRTLSFAIADGAFPSNEGRGYVLRRVLRRAVRYGQDILKMPLGSFSKLVAVLVRTMSDIFPELAEKESLVYEVILDEEETFARTLKRGVEKFQKEIQKLKADGKKVVPGSLSFFLYEAMGFPYDLTELMAAEHGLVMDKEGFDAKLQQHVERSRNARKAGGASDDSLRKLEAKETSYLEDNLKLIPTEHGGVYTWHEDASSATVQAIFDGENFVESVELNEDGTSNKTYGFVLDKSNFYYESGGQLADSGLLVLESDPTLVVAVSDCQSSKGFIVHAGSLDRREDEENKSSTQTIKVGDKVTCKVDYERRGDLAKNHTCTHLLNFALRKAVAADIDQKGSLVTDEKLRFDFNSTKGVPRENLIEVEKIVRAKIRESLPVYTKVVPLADARRINSLRAVFGETYPDPVRVVSVGPKIDDIVADPLNEKWQDYSIELCGGTHLTKSSEARAFSLVSESALAKGIRRVICLTGDAAFKAASDAEALRARIENTSSLSGNALLAEQKALQRDLDEAVISVSDKHDLSVEVEKLARKLIQIQKEELAEASEKAMTVVQGAIDSGSKYVIYSVPVSGSFVPKLGGEIVKKTKNTPISIFLVQGNEEDNSVLFFASVPKSESSKLAAQEWVETAGEPCGVKGGGSPMMFNGKGSGMASIQGCVELAQQLAQKLN